MSEFFHISFNWALLFQQFVLLALKIVLIIGMAIWYVKNLDNNAIHKSNRRKS